jgi:uncharacterized phage protein gp47/JayE
VFLKKTADDILAAALQRITRDTDITVVGPGGMARTFFEISARELENDFALLDANIQQMFLSTAGGEGLELIGNIFGIERKTVAGTLMANVSNVMFYLSDKQKNQKGLASAPAPVAFTIPAGTSISTAPMSNQRVPTVWKTVTPTLIKEGEYMAFADVVPVRTMGDTTPKGSLIYHDFDQLSVPQLSDGTQLYVQVYNRADVEVKTSYESDTNYRYRIRYALRTMAAGNATAIRLSALSVSGVRDVSVIPLAQGVGTVKVVIVVEKPGTPEGDTAFIEASNRVAEAKSAGDLVFIRRPNELPVDLSLYLYYNQNASTGSVANMAENAAIRCINRLSAGEPLSVNKLIHDVMSVSPDIAEAVIVPGVGLMINGAYQPISSYTVSDEDQLYASTVTILEQLDD